MVPGIVEGRFAHVGTIGVTQHQLGSLSRRTRDAAVAASIFAMYGAAVVAGSMSAL